VSNYKQIPLGEISPPKIDARTMVDEDKFEELVASIRRLGVLEPVVLRPTGDNEYEVVLGARRVLAANAAGLGKIPAIVRKIDDTEVDAIRLDENVIREDMNPVDIGRFIIRVMQAHGINQSEVARRFGRDPAWVSQMVGLVQKDPVITKMVENEEISYTVGRELLRVPNEQRRHFLASHVKRSGANVPTVRQWVAKELRDREVARENFEPPSAEPAPATIPGEPVKYPCQACNRLGNIEAMTHLRLCPDCGDMIEGAIKQGVFSNESVPERPERPEPAGEPEHPAGEGSSADDADSVPPGDEGSAGEVRRDTECDS